MFNDQLIVTGNSQDILSNIKWFIDVCNCFLLIPFPVSVNQVTCSIE